MTSGGSRRRECLKPAKKQALRRPERCAAPVQPCLSPSGLPTTRRERRFAFPGSQVFGAGTLPVWGTGGRSAPGRRRQSPGEAMPLLRQAGLLALSGGRPCALRGLIFNQAPVAGRCSAQLSPTGKALRPCNPTG